jgi:hypothetical protein
MAFTINLPVGFGEPYLVASAPWRLGLGQAKKEPGEQNGSD